MSDEEEPAPCVPVSENDSEDDDAGSDAEQTSMTQKRRKTCVTKYEDEYAGEALSVKANTGKFLGLRAEKPVKFKPWKNNRVQCEGFNNQARWEAARKRIPPSVRMIGVDP